jgi:agmatine deiminase
MPSRSESLRRFRMPAEWESHNATWLAWPHFEADWPGKLDAVRSVYVDMVAALTEFERVEILCGSEAARERVAEMLRSRNVQMDRVRLHDVPTDRAWVRDSGPTAVVNDAGQVTWLTWAFNGWAKYANFAEDARVGRAIADLSQHPRVEPARRDTRAPIVLEGGGIDANGDGLLLVTEEWLLSDVQVRNPGLTRNDYEAIFEEWLGARRTIWLGQGAAGDDTHGHVDDVARFVTKETVVLAVEEDPADDNYARSHDNVARLAHAGITLVKLPYPRPQFMDGQRLPASYANFYMANGVVLVPTFRDPNDRVALTLLGDLLHGRRIVGIDAVDLVWGHGTVHCLTQQEPSQA